jgi:hypothetical protein
MEKVENTENTENTENNLINLPINKIIVTILNKKFWHLLYNQKCINIHLNNALVPFGVEKYNDKLILNLELFETNENNNIISKIEALENEIQKYFKNMGLTKSLKKSKLGYLVRSHYLKSTECYILKKNGEKMMIDENNLQNAECEFNLLIKGIWINDNNYGLYIIINSIKINKFN